MLIQRDKNIRVGLIKEKNQADHVIFYLKCKD